MLVTFVIEPAFLLLKTIKKTSKLKISVPPMLIIRVKCHITRVESTMKVTSYPSLKVDLRAVFDQWRIDPWARSQYIFSRQSVAAVSIYSVGSL